ncbi:MAG: hypothetical protein ACTSRZ_20635 [Promethearchaeota archaeon]
MTLKIKMKDGSDSPEINFIKTIIFSQKDYNAVFPSILIFPSKDKNDSKEEYFPFKEKIPEIRKLR